MSMLLLPTQLKHCSCICMQPSTTDNVTLDTTAAAAITDTTASAVLTTTAEIAIDCCNLLL
jgi:hypothetical protein